MNQTKTFGIIATVLFVFAASFALSPDLAEQRPGPEPQEFGFISPYFDVLWRLLGLIDVPEEKPEPQGKELNSFSSCTELESFLEAHSTSNHYGYYGVDMVMMEASAPAPMAGSAQRGDDGGASDYSGTNVQVAGVDEADIVKSDGRYLYVLTGDELVIVDAYPARTAEKLSSIDTDFYASEMFVNGDKLVIFGTGDYYETRVLIYDISDREDPELEESLTVDGYYVDSRMIGNYVYLIANEPAYYYAEDDLEIPAVTRDGEIEGERGCGTVYYFEDMPEYHTFTNIVSIDLDDNDVSSEVYLTGSAENIYMSSDNIYMVYTSYGYYPDIAYEAAEIAIGMPVPREYEEKTIIHKLAAHEGDIIYMGEGEVPGHVLNQFSMDEHDGHFRIATTVGNVARFADQASSTNNVYVLDEDMEVVGELEDLAPGEKIYSARFMGQRCYLVTFRKVDPLFVIDLADPENPEVLGKLKIPGYSDYLHPYGEDYLIGLGKDAIPAEEGDFSWYQGVKLSLFDVSDFENPKEISVVTIGDRGTESYALHDHKAFLFSEEKNLLVIPILLAEVDESRYAGRVEPNTHGDYVYQGAYVFSVDPEDGFELTGRITHLDDDKELLKSGYYFDSAYSVKRSLYMDDVLYTISDEKVLMNRLGDLKQVNEVALN